MSLVQETMAPGTHTEEDTCLDRQDAAVQAMYDAFMVERRVVKSPGGRTHDGFQMDGIDEEEEDRCVCMRVCVYVCVCVCISICIYVYMYIYIHIYICVCVCIYIYHHR